MLPGDTVVSNVVTFLFKTMGDDEMVLGTARDNVDVLILAHSRAIVPPKHKVTRGPGGVWEWNAWSKVLVVCHGVFGWSFAGYWEGTS